MSRAAKCLRCSARVDRVGVPRCARAGQAVHRLAACPLGRWVEAKTTLEGAMALCDGCEQIQAWAGGIDGAVAVQCRAVTCPHRLLALMAGRRCPQGRWAM